jgi:DNA-binding transcriptional LysR family regulator
MELRQLQHFEALYRLRSFTRAAAEQYLTQPALSRSIRSLEVELGQTLFDRSTHSVEPTAAADMLIAYAMDAIAAARALGEAADVLRGGGQGAVRIGSGPYPAQPLMPTVVRKLSAAYPELRVSVVGGTANDLLAALLRRDLDFVVCDASKFEDVLAADDVSVVKLAPEPLVVVAGAENPMTRAEPTRADLAACPWAMPPVAPLGRRRLSKFFGGLSWSRFPLYEMDTTVACLDVTRDQRTITLVPLSLAQTECASRGLLYRSAGRDYLTNDGIHVLRTRTASTSVRLAIDAIVTEADRLAEVGRRWLHATGASWVRPEDRPR